MIKKIEDLTEKEIIEFKNELKSELLKKFSGKIMSPKTKREMTGLIMDVVNKHFPNVDLFGRGE